MQALPWKVECPSCSYDCLSSLHQQPLAVLVATFRPLLLHFQRGIRSLHSHHRGIDAHRPQTKPHDPHAFAVADALAKAAGESLVGVDGRSAGSQVAECARRATG